MKILNQTIVKITFQKCKDFFRPVLIWLGFIIFSRVMFSFLLILPNSTGDIYFVVDDVGKSLGRELFMIWIAISFVNGLGFAIEIPKFIKRGISRTYYFIGSSLAIISVSIVSSVVITILNLILTSIFSTYLPLNALILDNGLINMIIIYVLGGVAGYLIGFCLVLGWLKTGLNWKMLFLGVFAISMLNMLSLPMRAFEGFLENVWDFIIMLTINDTFVLIITVVLVIVLSVVNNILLRCLNLKVK